MTGFDRIGRLTTREPAQRTGATRSGADPLGLDRRERRDGGSIQRTEHEPDASDVVEGPVGDSSLKDPATSGPIGADLDALVPIEVPPKSGGEDDKA